MDLPWVWQGPLKDECACPSKAFKEPSSAWVEPSVIPSPELTEVIRMSIAVRAVVISCPTLPGIVLKSQLPF